MKDTLIPLHLIFMDANGTVTRVVASAPKNRIDVSGHVPSQYVLEMDARSGMTPSIQVGDQMSYKEDL